MSPTESSGWHREWPLGLALAALALALLGRDWIGSTLDQPAGLILRLVVICLVILIAAFAIVRHADVLAHRLGEPAGTLLLTLAIPGLEVAMVGFVMSTGEPKPALARDTMFAVVMLVLNGFMGLALLLGGLRHREQPFNLQSANAFLALIVPLTVLGLVLPNYTRSTPGPVLSPFQMVFLSVMSVGIYTVFLWVQNRRHRGFFMPREELAADAAVVLRNFVRRSRPAARGSGLGIGAAAGFAGSMGAPVALGGFIMALLVLTPESLAAIRAARANHLQRSVNILLGSVLASIGLTIPLVISISLATDRPLVLGLEAADMVMLLLTLLVSILTFSLPRTNLLLGCVHLLLFGAYLMLMFDRST